MAWTIGQLARQAAVSVETIKFYQRRGLIEVPGTAGPAGRLYSEVMLKRLKFIRYAKSLQFSLKEIGLMLGLHDHSTGVEADTNIREILSEKIKRIDDQISTLGKVREVLATLVAGESSADPIEVFSRLADDDAAEGWRGKARTNGRRKSQV